MLNEEVPSVDASSEPTDTAGVRLPVHLHWGPAREFDVRDPYQRRRLYEIVLREGRGVDIRRYVDLDQLVLMWNELVLPANIREAWADYFERVRGLVLPRARGRSPVLAGAEGDEGRL